MTPGQHVWCEFGGFSDPVAGRGWSSYTPDLGQVLLLWGVQTARGQWSRGGFSLSAGAEPQEALLAAPWGAGVSLC